MTEERAPERIVVEVELGEQLRERLWWAETPIGKRVRVFLPPKAAGNPPASGDRVRVEFHPYEMSRARIVAGDPS